MDPPAHRRLPRHRHRCQHPLRRPPAVRSFAPTRQTAYATMAAPAVRTANVTWAMTARIAEI
eukprot:161846-Prymnesium_polylepis.1